MKTWKAYEYIQGCKENQHAFLLEKLAAAGAKATAGR
jgi:hypothetical protein